MLYLIQREAGSKQITMDYDDEMEIGFTYSNAKA